MFRLIAPQIQEADISDANLDALRLPVARAAIISRKYHGLLKIGPDTQWDIVEDEDEETDKWTIWVQWAGTGECPYFGGSVSVHFERGTDRVKLVEINT